jgi:glycosyltransferase involved in cell wall biosynthesis
LRHLPDFGYGARVLTTSAFGGREEEGVLRAWEPLKAYRWLFNREARDGRAPSTVRTRPGLLRRLGRQCLVPDLQLTWVPFALWRGLRALHRDKYDLLYSSYPPASAHLLGLLLKGHTGLPWVADFRDSWIYDPLDPALSASPYRRACEARLEEAVIRCADAVVVATEAVADHLRQSYPEAASRVRVVTNGFEPAEFTRTAPPPFDGPLRIAHTGSFSISHPQRTPQPLFAALESLLAVDSTWAQRLQLELVGLLSPEEERAAQDLVDAGILQLAGPQERAAALACQQRAHVLLLVDHVRPWPATNVPGKLYEYLAAERPVLALAGEGMVERLVRELDLGVFARADDPVAIRSALESLYARFRQQALGVRLDPRVLRRYHRRELTRELAQIFDGLVGR